MNTIVKKIEPQHIRPEDFTQAANILQKGGLVAFPTETVYGLGADGLDETASAKIYAAKGRPSDNPLIIHIADTDTLRLLTKKIPEAAEKLAEKFWPGPLTMIFEKSDCVPKGTTGGLDTVAVRMPSHPVALELIRSSGLCIAAPSANTSGRPSPTKAEHVYEDLNGRIDMILDGGEVQIGIESTIVDVTSEIPVILRPGFITKEMLEAEIGEVICDPAILAEKPDKNLVPKAPGMKYRHYAPKGDLRIIEGNLENVTAYIRKHVKEKTAAGCKVGIIATEETRGQYPEGIVKTIGSRKEEASILHGLYGVLREFDDIGAEYIYSESFSDGEHGQAVMNRLLKAAGYQKKNV
jgi:L-threonylcarbamoyladenylate synthase